MRVFCHEDRQLVLHEEVGIWLTLWDLAYDGVCLGRDVCREKAGNEDDEEMVKNHDTQREGVSSLSK